MLTRLSIRDFAVVAHSELEFGPGMTVISGQTGAGKSLLVDAMSFLSGQRADAGMVRHGAERAELSAEFDLTDSPDAAAWLLANELDEESNQSCELRRTLRTDARSKAWINGRVVSINQLAALAGLLVEIHGQHEHQALLSKPAQLQLLDAFGQHESALEAVKTSARHWQTLCHKRDNLSAHGDIQTRIDWLQYQIDELAEHAPAFAAFADLLQEHRRYAHSSSLIEHCQRAHGYFSDAHGDGITQRIGKIRQHLDAIIAHEPRLAEIDNLLETASIQLDEAEQQLAMLADDFDNDPQHLQALEKQLSRIYELARKHSTEPEQLGALQQQFEDELQQLQNATHCAAELDNAIATAAAQWQTDAANLRDARSASAARLSTAVSAIIKELGMHSGQFSIAIEPVDSNKPDVLGSERVEFLVTANSGQPPRPLRKVASGGELARISLAIEVAALGKDAIASMMFDEVDTGIGGAVAHIVGQKLRQLGQTRQVLCVTHLPQVAAHGHHHYQVSKADDAQGITRSAVKLLDKNERIEELARMLGGVDIGEEARAAAARLLRDAQTTLP